MRFGPLNRSLMAVLLSAGLVLAGCSPAGEAEGTTEPETPAAEPIAETEPGVPVEDPTAEGTEPTTEVPDEGSPGSRAEDVVVTAYVVAYHWGWAIFDEEGRDLEVLQVPVGATVELFAVNDHASEAIGQFPAPVAQAIQGIDWKERAHHDQDAGRMAVPAGSTLDEMLHAVHDDHALENHGLLISGVGAGPVQLDAHAHEPAHLVFTVDEEGSFLLICTEMCGVGHAAMIREMLRVGPST